MLFTVVTGPGWDNSHIAVLKLDTGERRIVLSGGHTGSFVPTGHLVYYRAGTLLAVPFDPVRLEVTNSTPVSVADGIKESGATIYGAEYSFSAAGSLAYVPASPRQFERRLVWVDRKGSIEPLSAPLGNYQSLSLSPDGRRVAVAIASGTREIWTYDIAGGTMTRLTTESNGGYPIWTHDGKRIVYRSDRAGFRNIFWKSADGTGDEEQLTKGNNMQTPYSCSPDGKYLAFGESNPTTGSDIWILPLSGERKQQSFLGTTFGETLPSFSPDSRWLAYQSNELGRTEIYVQSFPGRNGKLKISVDGGSSSHWAGNGRELFYRSGRETLAVDIKTEPILTAGKPMLLFEGQFVTGSLTQDVTSDGQHFLMIQSVEPEQPAMQINLVLNWFEELKQKVQAAK